MNAPHIDLTTPDLDENITWDDDLQSVKVENRDFTALSICRDNQGLLHVLMQHISGSYRYVRFRLFNGSLIRENVTDLPMSSTAMRRAGFASFVGR